MFRIRGIQLSVHFTFLLLLGYVSWDGAREDGWIGAAVNIVTVLAFFFCIVLHELGHSFTARRFGVKVPRILLLPIGGVAEFSALPRRPRQEILIALAGPAVNFAILALIALFGGAPSWPQLRALELTPVQLLFAMNLTMGTFNLLPAFPMDGGRVLRALLARHLPYLRATWWAVNIGKLIALAGVIFMLFVRHNLLGGVLFLFILFVGEMEYRTVLRQEVEDERWKRFLARIYGDSDAPSALNQ